MYIILQYGIELTWQQQQMFQHRQQVRVRSSMTKLSSQQLKHGRRTLGVHMWLVKPPCKFSFIFVANHFEELDVSVKGFVLVFA